MAEETWKSEEEAKTPAGLVYKQVAPAGLAAEMTADDPVAAGTATALGRWLTETLGPDRAVRERVATLSGLSAGELSSLMDGHPLFPLDTDHVQRIATALVEARVIPHADAVWAALGSGSGSGSGASEYIVPPAKIVQAMSGNSDSPSNP